MRCCSHNSQYIYVSSSTIERMAVVVDQQLHHEFKSPFCARPLRCKLQSYSHLDNHNNIPDPLDNNNINNINNNLAHSLKQAFVVANIHRSISSPCLPLTPKPDEEKDYLVLNPRVEIIGARSDPKTRALVVEVAIAMASGVNPVPVSTGLSGAYFLRGSRKNETIAVVKPISFNNINNNNSKGFTGMRRSIRVGETGIRELAAYILDHDNFSGVPPTALVKISHVAFYLNNNTDSTSIPPKKIASLQRFIDHNTDAGDLGPSSFSVSSIHKIGILDIRLLNLDRHAGNMLVKKTGLFENNINGVNNIAYELVPIDHGLCLPEWLDDPYFEWLHWPQASVPFSESEIEYISNLDPFKEAELLRKELSPSMRESSIRVLIICTIFLKNAVGSELCLADIGEMMTREFYGGEEKPSVLENICLRAKDSMMSYSMPRDLNGKNFDFGGEEEIFQFDDEFKCPSPFWTGSVIKSATFSSARSLSELLDEGLSHLGKGDIYEVQLVDDYANNGKIKDNDNELIKTGALTKSMSFSEPNHKNENGIVSFGEMSEKEWELFLIFFERLLPEVFEERKSMGLMKQRLGTSCEF